MDQWMIVLAVASLLSVEVSTSNARTEGSEMSPLVRPKRQVNDPDHRQQPRILSQGGNMMFQAPSDRNITLAVSGRGAVLVNGEDIQRLADNVKENTRQIAQLQQSGLSDLLIRISAIEQRLNGGGSTSSGSGTGSTVPPDLTNLNYRVTNLEIRINQLNATLLTNECLSGPCQNGASCYDSYQGYQCSCSAGWTGSTCSQDINECQTLGGSDLGCQNGATCINTPGSFQCSCTANWYGTRCTEAHDDCSSASNEALCGHGTCQNVNRATPGEPRYRCFCESGWTTNGIQPMCNVDINECTAGRPPCSVNPPVQCINLPGSFVCGSCPPGYSGDGYSCSDIDECQLNNGGCSLAPRVDCVNTLGSRTCGQCPNGYTGNGLICTFVGVCGTNNGGCHSMATCQEAPGIIGRSCTCPVGYVGNGVGPNGCVSSSLGPCANNPCAPNGLCQVVNGDSSYTCVCNAGWTGSSCNQPVNPCISQPCMNNGTCQLSAGGQGYTCTCTSSFTGLNCQTPQQACGGSLNAESGSLSYPSQSSQLYPHGVDCIWIITTLPNKILVLSFPRFKVEYHYNCDYDFLQIHDGPSTSSYQIGRYCGQVPPGVGTINSTSNQIYLWFHSDASVASDGFTVNWISAVPSCGGYLFGQLYGVISSPGYPGNYPNNRDCSWVVSVPPGRTILFTFSSIALEHHENCTYDYLEIRDGMLDSDRLLRRYCSTMNPVPPPLSTTGPYAHVRFHSDELLTDRGFSISYTAQTGCGREYTADHGVLTSPGFPNPYPHNSYCIYTISVPAGEVITFNITNIDIEAHANCFWDYLMIREGLDETGAFVGRFCGNVTPPVYVSNSNNLWIKFQSDEIESGSGFRATWDVVCGGLFTATSGEIRSPYFPNAYPSNKECVYVIRQSAGSIITLTFTVFDVEATLSNSTQLCLYDYVEVRNGESIDAPLIGRYCGSTIPSPVHSTGSSLWIKFKSDSSVQNHGFRAQYESSNTGSGTGGGIVPASPTNACGGTLTGLSGAFSSPSYPNTYPHGANCTWFITTTPGFVIRLSFTTFSLEYHYQCRWDYVEIFDNYTASGSLGRYCGTDRPSVMTSSDNVMTVVFVSDVSVALEGFSASYVAFNASAVCGGELRSAIGVIKSPNYPNNYPNNRECEWTIVAPNGRQILLNVTDFQLEGHTNCQYDYLEIRNGGFASSPLIGRYCGTNIPPSIVSHSNRMFLKFLSDYSIGRRGFRITYDSATSGCGGELTTTTGSFTSPNYPLSYQRNSECTWKITVAHGSRVHLHFVDFNMETHSTCAYDYVEIRDFGTHGTLLAKLCGNLTTDTVESISNQMWVKFRSDWWNQGRGFHATYHAVCNNVLTAYYGVVESPNFPNQYPANRDCTWIIEASMGNTINATFSHFSLQIGNGLTCNNDYLELRDGRTAQSRLVNRVCGSTQLPPSISTTSQWLYVRFVSDSSVSRNGFRLEYVTVGCGGHFTAPTGEFTSLNYPNPYPHSRQCEWYIAVPPGNRVEITLLDFDVEQHTNCSYDVLQIYGGMDYSSPLLSELCHSQPNGTQQVLTTTGNNALVVFITDIIENGRGFRLRYRAVPDGCGGNYTARTAVIMSKNYPQPYPHNTDCLWYITVDPLHRVLLTFSDFDVEGSTLCTYDYVAVYGNIAFNTSQLLRACGNTLPNPSVIRSDSNQMIIRMRTDYSVSRRGFKATYTTSCGRILNADTDGLLQSPGWPSVYEMNADCYWLIQATSSSDRVTLTFTHLDIESSANCSADYVRVLDGDDIDAPIVGTFCGTMLPLPVTSGGSALGVRFITNAVNQRPGFTASYTTSTSACGGDFTAEHGAFSSPRYPDAYPNNIECVWTVTSSPGNRVMLTFSVFNVEWSAFCNNDFVEVRRDSSTGPVLGRYCGNTIPTNASFGHNLWIRFRSNGNVQGQGFTAVYNTLYGGELVNDAGNLSSPLYRSNYPPNVDYSWTITVALGRLVRVTFVDMDVEPSSNCVYDYVKLLDGSTSDSPVLGKYCGSTLPSPVTTSSNQVRVEFHSDEIISGRGFLLSWLPAAVAPPSSVVPGCGGNLTALNVTMLLQSPGFPNGYDNNLDCWWTITANVGQRVWIQFTNMSLEYHPECHYDSVAIYEVINDVISSSAMTYQRGSYCGNTLPSNDTVSTTNVLSIRFQTDYSYNRTGFALNYKAVCGGLIQANSGRIQSPNYPGSYPDGLNCTWIIEVMRARKVRISFTAFSVTGTTSQCSNGDYVKIYSGASTLSPSLGKFCGTALPPQRVSSHRYMTVQFVSNSDGQASSGFQLDFQNFQLACGGHSVLDSMSSVNIIKSPHYPNLYPANTDCTWVITAPANKRVQLDFTGVFNIEPHPGCQNDFVEVRDGGTVNSPLIGSFCGTSLPSTQVSAGHVMFVRFRSDGSERRAGFNATARIAVCGGTINAANGTITSPNYPANYPSNMTCEWFINAPTGHFITLRFRDSRLEYNANCSLADYVEIRDYNSTGPVLRRLCGFTWSQIVVNTSDSFAYIKFQSNSLNNYRGFQINFTASVEECGGTLTTPVGSLTSPNYPGHYAHSRQCVWSIRVAEGRKVTLTFTDIDMQDSRIGTVCFDDYVELYNGIISGSPWMGRYCGSVLPTGSIESSSNTMKVIFRSDGAGSGRGFAATYSSNNPSDCEPAVNNVIQSTGFHLNSSYNTSEQCMWVVNNPTLVNSSITVRFLALDLERHGECLYDYVELREGSNENGGLIGRYCQTDAFLPAVIVTPSSSLWIRFSSDVVSTERGFQLVYNFTECGGVLDSDRGVIASPNYPQNYPLSANCAWKIVAPEGVQIKVTFTAVILGNAADCSRNYIEVFNGGYATSPSVGRYCQSSPLPSDIISQGNELRVSFHGDGLTTAQGFRLTYEFVTTGCGGTIHAQQGVVSSPNYPQSYNDSIECVWDITVSNGYHIIMSFVGQFDLEISVPCTADYVEIFDVRGTDNQAISRGRYCGNEVPAALNSTGNRIRVLFRSNEMNNGNGFSISYSSGCGATYYDLIGAVMSPGYPNNYADNLDCTYDIIGDPQKLTTIRFNPDHFRIETVDMAWLQYLYPNHSLPVNSTDFRCPWDWLQISSFNNATGVVRQLGRFCGFTAPDAITSLGSIRLQFHTDSYHNDRGWVADYEIRDCGGNYTSPTGSISTNLHPNNYHDNSNCTWIISVPGNKVVKLRFETFNIEPHSQCMYDYVDVYNGAEINATNRIGRYCGIVIPLPVISNSNTIVVNFVSDEIVTMGGFSAEYTSVYGPIHGCGGIINATTSSTIRSLDVDQNGFYEDNLDCVWQIIAPSNSVVVLRILNLNLQPPVGQTCYDTLEVRDGLYETDPVIGRYCGQFSSGLNITAISNVLYVRFTSDESISSSGFTAVVTTAPRLCGGSLSSVATWQTLTSPNYPQNYPHNTRCSWIIDAPEFEQLEINVTDINLELHTTCNYDRLEIADYPQSEFSHSVVACRMSDIRETFLSTSRSVHVAFITDYSNAGRGFSLTYKTASCNRNYTSSLTGRIVSPRWPANYPLNADCLIYISTPPGNQLSIYFALMDIEPHSQCSWDYLEIYNGTSLSNAPVARLCGSTTPNPVFLASNTAVLKFVTDYSVTRRGYDLTFTASNSGCGGELNAINGTFTSPWYPSVPASATNCQWLVRLPPRRNIRLQLRVSPPNTVNSTNTNCANSFVTVYNGVSTTASAVIGRYCTAENIAALTSTNNVMRIIYVSSNVTSSNIAFQATYWSRPYIPS